MNVLYRRFLKPLLDFSVATLLLVLLSPILLVIAILVRIRMGKPILFKQDRLGLNQEVFTLFKFRTMRVASSSNGKLLPDLQRTTTLGRFLRRTSLDELPQLWNVVRGEMSFIGPRPMPVNYGPYFVFSEMDRFLVPPGITGLAQVSGRNQLTWSERFGFDVVYATRCSFRFDLVICARTLKTAVTREGFVLDPQSLMANFDDERRRDGAIDDIR